MNKKKMQLLDFIEIFGCVLIGHVGRTDVQFEIGAEVFKVIIVR